MCGYTEAGFSECARLQALENSAPRNIKNYQRCPYEVCESYMKRLLRINGESLRVYSKHPLESHGSRDWRNIGPTLPRHAVFSNSLLDELNNWFSVLRN